MKYVVVLGDGMADYRYPELGDVTPLSYADTPNMDRLAQNGVLGLARTVPEGYPPGSDVANLSVFGFDPLAYYTGRSPIEAVSMGIELSEDDVSFRCNLVTLSDEEHYEEKVMVDYSAGEIPSRDASLLIAGVDSLLGTDGIKFYPGISYRHLMVWKGGPLDTCLTPPHDISGRNISGYLPHGPGGRRLLDIMKKSFSILSGHPYNQAQGGRKANSVWFWGQGKRPSLPEFSRQYGLSGGVISAVDLIMGIGICSGLEVIPVQGATGNIHTNFKGKAAAALQALKSGMDFVYIHIEAPDEAGHQMNLQLKIKAIEKIDAEVLGPLLEGLAESGPYRLLLMPDHPTPVTIGTHTSEPVPFVLYDSEELKASGESGYDEEAGSRGIFVEEGHRLMGMLLKTGKSKQGYTEY